MRTASVSRLRSSYSLALLLVAGCAGPSRPIPIAVPQQPDIVTQAESDRQVRSTIVGGDAPVPSSPQRTSRVIPGRGDIAFNFPTAEVGVIAKSVMGDVLRVGYTVAPGIAAQQMTFVTPGKVARASVLGLFETALKAAGLALVPAASGYAIQPAGQAREPVTSEAIGSGSEILTLQFINADELKKVIDSVMPGVVTATDSSRNAITIAGTTGQRQSARDLTRQFDVNWLRNMSFALLVPQRTDSRLIVPELDKLINAADSPTRGLVRLIQMERLNGILAISAQRQYLDDVRRWIDILDREGENNEARLFVYRVQNGRARDLVKTLNGAFGIGGASGDIGPPADPLAAQNDLNTTQNAPRPVATSTASASPGSGQRESAATGNTTGAAVNSFTGRVSSDEVNNAVIVFGTPRDYAVVEDAMRKLDVPPTQVLIEAAITEVALTGDLSYGVDWNFIQGNSTFVSGSGNPAAPTANAAGFAYFLRTSDIGATLRALESRTNIKVISAPKLLVLNNQTAALQVGNQVPIQTQQQQSVGTGSANIVNSIEYRDTGVILRVTPRVNASGLVLLDISQEVSSVTNLTTVGISSPTIATRRIATTVAVQDGQVLGLGGLFSDAKTLGTNGLPLLSRIPILGALFGNVSDRQERRELIILIKPQIVRTPDDGRAMTEELRAKLRTLEPFRTEGRIP
ncbi:type II secretion system secretin GspD [Sphingomonas sp.]|uniref:type II secretion system secretin GspD n=1 Tax=Sphingomonas sp. TaxID=28214 RepID=UPI0025EA184D|nr:type II secretion system secretin GspD [Sphingomonas sp.]